MQIEKNVANRFRWIAALSLFATAGFLVGVLFTASNGWNKSAGASPAANFTANGESPFVDVAEKIKPSVVNIQCEKKGMDDQQFQQFHNSPFFDPFNPFDNEEPQPKGNARRAPKTMTGGSGFIVGTDGLILTNNHVVENADKIKVKFSGGEEQTAEIVGRDPDTDVALIKVKEKFDEDKVIKWGDSDKLRVGEWAIAVGNPFGLDWTVTVGVISAKGRANLPIAGGGPAFQDFIQTDASINFGNSGGPLLNIHGQVVGINSAVNTQGQGIGFAIPSNMAQRVMAQLQTKGKVERGYLGLVPTEFGDDKRAALKAPKDIAGIFVDNVQENTPADKAGLHDGDVITNIEGKSFTDPVQFRLFVADHVPGDKLSVNVWRDGSKHDYEIVLGDRNEYIAQNGGSVNVRDNVKNWLGIEVTEAGSVRAKQLRVTAETGVVVMSVEQDSPADNVLQRGDVILEVDKTKIESLSDWRKVHDKLKDDTDAILFRIQRGENKTYVTITPK